MRAKGLRRAGSDARQGGLVPNQCDDMHTLPASGQPCPAYFGSNPGGNKIKMGDDWLSAVVPSLLAQPNVTVLITWDESGASTTPPSTS